jgi:antirestriction protein
MKHTQEAASAFFADAKTHISEEAFLAFVEMNSNATETLEELLEQASESYAGEFKSFKELAEQQVDDGLWGDIPDHLKNYIDCEAIGRDLRLGGDFWENNGHFFSSNY